MLWAGGSGYVAIASVTGTGIVHGAFLGAGAALLHYAVSGPLWLQAPGGKGQSVNQRHTLSTKIRAWHLSQFFLFWVIALFVGWLDVQFMLDGPWRDNEPIPFPFNWLLGGLLFIAIPISLAVATWIWFGGWRDRAGLVPNAGRSSSVQGWSKSQLRLAWLVGLVGAGGIGYLIAGPILQSGQLFYQIRPADRLGSSIFVGSVLLAFFILTFITWRWLARAR